MGMLPRATFKANKIKVILLFRFEGQIVLRMIKYFAVELSIVVEPGGFEPPTFAMQTRRSPE
jgi:hypothetical protein